MSKKIVFFDLDGTILGGVSSENAFIFHLLLTGNLGLKQCWSAFVFLFKYFPEFKQFVFVKNKAYLNNLSVDEISKIADQLVQKKLLKKIRKNLLAIIEQHRKAGDLLVLLTGSPEFLAAPIACFLKMDCLEATKCCQEGGKFLQAPPLQHPFAEQKLEIARRVCEEYKIDLKDCVAYGNSYNDRILLREVGRAVAVTPSRRLRQVSEKKGGRLLIDKRFVRIGT